MDKLIPLSKIPSTARASERRARAKYESRADALAAARYGLVEAPGTYSGAEPRTFGWLCSQDAAEATAAAAVVRMPGNTQHRLYAVRTL